MRFPWSTGTVIRQAVLAIMASAATGTPTYSQETSGPEPILTLKTDSNTSRTFRTDIDYSPRGKFLARWKRLSVSEGLFSRPPKAHLKVWNASNGQEVLTHVEPFRALVYSPDEQTLIVQTKDENIGYNLNNGHERGRLAPGNAYFVQDGQVLLTIDGTIELLTMKDWLRTDGKPLKPPKVTIKAWNAATWEPTQHPMEAIGPLCTRAAVSSNLEFIAGLKGDYGDLRVWELETGNEVPAPGKIKFNATFPLQFLCGNQVLAIPQMPATPPPQGRFRFWNIAEGKWLERRNYIHPFPVDDPLRRFRVSPSITVELNDADIVVREFATDRIRKRFRKPTKWEKPWSNKFPRDGGSQLLNEDVVLLQSAKAQIYELQFWDVDSTKLLKTVAVPTSVYEVVSSYRGRTVAIRTALPIVEGRRRSRIELWDTVERKKKSAFEFPERVSAIAFCPDDKLLVTACGRDLYYIDTAAGEEIDRVQFKGSDVIGMCFSPDGERLFISTNDGIEVWDVEGREIKDTFKDYHECSLTLSRDGSHLAAWSSGRVSVIDPANGQLVAQYSGVNSSLEAVFFRENTHVFGVSTQVSLDASEWRVGWQEDFTKPFEDDSVPRAVRPRWSRTRLSGVQEIDNGADSVTQSRDSGSIAVASSEMNFYGFKRSAIHLFSPADHKGLGTLAVGAGEIQSLAFAAGGRQLVVGLKKQEVSLDFIDLRRGTLIRSLKNHRLSAQSPAGRYLVTKDMESMKVSLWSESGKSKPVELSKVVPWRFSPDGKTFAAAAEGVINIWRIEDFASP